MHLLPRAFQAVATLTFVAALSACGGGSGGDDAAAKQKSLVDPYVGTWAVCIKALEPGKSWREEYTFTKLSATTGEIVATASDFSNEECQGEPYGWNRDRDTIEWTGETVVVDNLAVDKIIIRSGTFSSSHAPIEVPAEKVITEYQVLGVVNSNQLRVGTFTESNLQTYPQHLWEEILLRQ